MENEYIKLIEEGEVGNDQTQTKGKYLETLRKKVYEESIKGLKSINYERY